MASLEGRADARATNPGDHRRVRVASPAPLHLGPGLGGSEPQPVRGNGHQIAVRWIVSGQVQGVGFRWFTQRRAEQLGLVGWVKNLPGGQVEVVARGAPASVQTLEEQLWRGPSMAVVKTVEKSEIQHDAVDCK